MIDASAGDLYMLPCREYPHDAVLNFAADLHADWHEETRATRDGNSRDDILTNDFEFLPLMLRCEIRDGFLRAIPAMQRFCAVR